MVLTQPRIFGVSKGSNRWVWPSLNQQDYDCVLVWLLSLFWEESDEDCYLPMTGGCTVCVQASGMAPYVSTSRKCGSQNPVHVPFLLQL